MKIMLVFNIKDMICTIDLNDKFICIFIKIKALFY